MIRVSVPLLIFALGPVGQAIAQESGAVPARTFFAQKSNCDKDRPIRIEVQESGRLVFDAQDNKEYVLGGCSLHILARTVVVRGDVIVRAFDPSFTPGVSVVPAQAGRGADGAGRAGGAGADGLAGQPGVDAGLIT